MLFDSNGAKRDWTPLSDISPNLVRAVIAAEDGKFCSHDGFDREAIEKALTRNIKGGRMRGGSTISQQTAKNVFLWQGSGWTRYLRKVPEVYFTFLIEKIWGKRRIMEVYLNVAETGIGTYGAEAGAQRYYKHSAARLSRIEAARIAAAGGVSLCYALAWRGIDRLLESAAVAHGVSCITTIPAVDACLLAIEALRTEPMTVQSLQERFAGAATSK